MWLLFPFILFVSLSALMMGMLQAQGRFFIPHSASTFFNLTSIVAGLSFAYILSPDYIIQVFQKLWVHQQATTTDFLIMANALTGMALGSLLGGLGQLFLQWPLAHKLGFRAKFLWSLKNKELRKVLALTGPAIIGGAAVQVNVLINTEFASLLQDGAVAYLNFAFRFMQFPLGVFGVAIASASAPVLARLVSAQKWPELKSSLQSSIRMSLFLSVPSMIGLIVLGDEIIRLIYEHGRFTTTDTLNTATALSAYSLGIVSYSLIKIYQPAFLAFHDAKTPMRVSLFSIFVNLILNAVFILIFKLPHWAVALSTALVATSNFIFLSLKFKKHAQDIWDQNTIKALIKTGTAALIMGMGCWFIKNQLQVYLPGTTLIEKCFRVFIPVSISAFIYFASGSLLKIEEAHLLSRRLFKKRVH